MKLLNLCCGAVRPQGEEWVNVDNIRVNLHISSPERINLDKEKNYIDLNITMKEQRLPTRFSSGEFDGILASHCVEHWNCQEAVKVMSDCLYCLKPGGVLLVSVPDAELFRKNYDIDDGTNAVELYGEPVFEGDGEKTFVNYAMWNRWHKAIIDETVLWHYFKRAGFKDPIAFTTDAILGRPKGRLEEVESSYAAIQHMMGLLNRIPFSLVMCGVKE